jgi:hypothetical protein
VDHGLDMLAVSTIAENVESDKGLMHKRSGAWWLSTWPGGPLPKVGEQYGLAKGSVLELVRQAGRSVRHSRLSAHETAQLVALYKAGLPQKDIAKRLGRTPSAVWHCLRCRAGLVGAGQEDRPPDSLIET